MRNLKYASALLSLLIQFILIGCRNANTFTLKYSNELSHHKAYQVILMAGQSNMVGLGNIDDLESPLFPENIAYFNFGMNNHLEVLNHTFGPEIGISEVLAENFPNLNFIFIKYAVGGSSIEDWLPHLETKHNDNIHFGNLYEKFLKKIDSITKNYNTKDIALIWMQGETDARHLEKSINYEVNLKNFIGNIRKDLNNPQLPIIYGKVSSKIKDDATLGNVRAAQERIAKYVPRVYLISTDEIPLLSDNVHYSSRGLIQLGHRFGYELVKINDDN